MPKAPRSREFRTYQPRLYDWSKLPHLELSLFSPIARDQAGSSGGQGSSLRPMKHCPRRARSPSHALCELAVSAETGGHSGGGAVLTPVGKRVIALYRAIGNKARKAASQKFRSMSKLVRRA